MERVETGANDKPVITDKVGITTTEGSVCMMEMKRAF